MFVLVYLKPHLTQLLHGRLFGMRQSKATQWIHVLLPVLRNPLRTLGDAPCRRVEALREQVGVAEPPLPAEEAPAAPPAAAPLFVETIRVWKAGIRDMVMEIGCALHNFRIRLTPSWAPIV